MYFSIAVALFVLSALFTAAFNHINKLCSVSHTATGAGAGLGPGAVCAGVDESCTLCEGVDESCAFSAIILVLI